MRAVDRQDIHPRDHLIQTFPIGRLQLGFDLGAQPFAVVVVHLQAKGAGAACHSRADPAHAQNTQAPPTEPPTQMRHWRPALPFSRLQFSKCLRDAAGDGQHQRHRHIGGIIRHSARSVGHQNSALAGCGHINVIDARAIICNQLQLVASLGNQGCIDLVGDCRHQYIAILNRMGQFLPRHLRVGVTQRDIKQLFHARLDRLGQSSCHDNI